MSKDPAFLFYSSDFLTETYLMTNEEVGIFIKLICLQHQFGYLTKSDLSKFVNSDDSKVMQMFKEIDGKFYHMKTKEETERRKNFTESRRKNRQSIDSQSKRKNICKTHDESYVEHMETETETITKTNTLTKEGGMGGDFDWTRTKGYFMNAEEWMAMFCRSKGIGRETLVSHMTEFLNDMELRNEYKDLKELQRHFTNWYNKTSKKQNNVKSSKHQGRDELLESLRQRHAGYNPQ